MEDFEKAIKANNLKRQINIINEFNDDDPEFAKGHPVGYINKYGKQKQSDGSWKYVGKQGGAQAAAKPAGEKSSGKAETKTSKSKDVKVTGRKHEPGTMTRKEAQRANGSASAKDILTPDGLKKFETNLKSMNMRSRMSQLEDSIRFVSDDKRKVRSYQKMAGKQDAILSKLSQLQKDFIGTVETKAGRNKLKVTPDGKMYVNNTIVQVDNSSGFVKLGGGGRGSSVGGFYGRGHFEGQLQGVVHTNAASKLRGLILEGKSWKDIDKQMAEGKTVMSGTTYAQEWPILKRHLKL